MTTNDTLKTLSLSEEWSKSTSDGRNHRDPHPPTEQISRKDHNLDQNEAVLALDVKRHSTVGERTADHIIRGRTVPGARPPYGYRTVRSFTPAGIEKSWEHKEPEAEDVRQIFAMATSESGWRMSCEKIARRMSRSGSQRIFSPLRVYRILTSEIYVGTSTWCVSKRTGTSVTLTAPPLVSESDFQTVQVRLASRRRKKLKAASGGSDE